MKKAFFLILILAEVCHAQVPVPVIQPPSTQNHELAPQAEQYFWDTIANNWNYNLTMYLNYTGDRMTSNYAIDTITGVPIQFDTTVYDTLGRVTDMWQQTWNAGWQNALRISHSYNDTSKTNRSSFYYNGNGVNWTIFHGDSVYALYDISGNEIDRYYWLYDIPSGIFKPSGRTLMDYDLQNRIQCRRSFAWDTTLAQFKIYQIDSNFQYDLVFTTLATDQIQYTFTTGSQQPYSRQMVQFPGTSSYESTQTYLQYNLNQQQWENVNRFRFTAQSCNNIDTTFVEYWNTTSLAWDLSSGTKHIFNWIDSCDFNESIVQTFVPYLSIFRNYGKWVYPYSATTSIEDKTGNNKVSIFPNPFHTQAQLETNLDITSHNYILKIYNILGTLIREEEILNLNSYILHRDALNDGLYFYELRTTGYELIGSGKFVIN